MSLEVIQIPVLQNRLKVWENAKAFWLESTGTSFGHLNTEHYRKVKEAKQKLKNKK